MLNYFDIMFWFAVIVFCVRLNIFLVIANLPAIKVNNITKHNRSGNITYHTVGT